MHEVPTLKQMALKLNVSISTVSRALSDSPRIGWRTKHRVKELAKELNYEPNGKSIYFKKKKSFVIGVILPNIKEEFFSEAISGIELAAMEHEYTILFGQSFDKLEVEIKVVEAIKKPWVDGLIISLSNETNKFDHLESLKKYGIPIVYFDRVPAFANVHKVYCNLFKGTVDMIDWLCSRGYRRIAMINGPNNLLASEERFKGYVEGISRKKLKVDMELIQTTDFSTENTNWAIDKLLALSRPPDAIISFNDNVHMDAVKYSLKQNIQINKDIVFASYSNLQITQHTPYPPLVSVEQYPYSQGERAMELMIEVLKKKSSDEITSAAYFNEEVTGTLVMNADNKWKNI